MNAKTLDVLFHDTLKDIYYAERKILRALPKMARGSNSPDLKAAFEKHQEETQGQIDRLQQIFEILGKPARGKTCPAIDGIIEEGEEILQAFANSPALDAGLVAAAQAVEHYEISRYGTLRRRAQLLEMDEAVSLLETMLEEEEKTDATLTEIADGSVNQGRDPELHRWLGAAFGRTGHPRELHRSGAGVDTADPLDHARRQGCAFRARFADEAPCAAGGTGLRLRYAGRTDVKLCLGRDDCGNRWRADAVTWCRKGPGSR